MSEGFYKSTFNEVDHFIEFRVHLGDSSMFYPTPVYIQLVP